LARCIPSTSTTDGDATQQAARTQYAELAMQILQQAVTNGYDNRQQLENEPALHALRSRSDFAELLSQPAKKEK
jgi:hypothetical protein